MLQSISLMASFKLQGSLKIEVLNWLESMDHCFLLIMMIAQFKAFTSFTCQGLQYASNQEHLLTSNLLLNVMIYLILEL